MYLLACQILWTISKVYNCQTFTKEKSFMVYSILKRDFKMGYPLHLGGKGYSLLPWFMILQKQTINMKHIILEVIFNIQLYKGRSVMENVFKILKKTFKELLLKNNLHVLFLPDVFSCCYMLQNLILDERDVNIDALMLQLEQENQ
jgi:hypothetical protein